MTRMDGESLSLIIRLFLVNTYGLVQVLYEGESGFIPRQLQYIIRMLFVKYFASLNLARLC